MIHKDEELSSSSSIRDPDLIASAALMTTNHLPSIISTQNANIFALTKVPRSMKELSIKDSKKVMLGQTAEAKSKLTET